MGYGKEITYNTTGNIVTLFFQWLIIMLIPKLTDFTEAGIFAVAVSVSSIMNQIATFTLNQYQVADQNSKYSENDFAVARLVTIVLSFVCIIPVSFLFDYGMNQILIIVAYTVYRNIINYAYLHMASMQIMGRLDYAGKCMIIEGTVSFAVFVGTYAMFDNLLFSTISMAIIGGGSFILFMGRGYSSMAGHRYGLDIRNRDNLGNLLFVGAPLLVSTLCPIVITALPKLILENNWGQTTVGYFSTLTSPTIVIPTIATSIFAPFIVYFADICKKGDMRKLRIQYSKISAALLVMAAGLYVVSVLLSGKVFVSLYGETIEPYAPYFSILIVGIFFYSIGMCGITVLITKKQGKIAGVASFSAMMVSLIVFFAMIPSGGIGGATWGLTYAYGIFGLLVSCCVYLVPLEKKHLAEP